MLLDEEQWREMAARFDKLPFRHEEAKKELQEIYREGKYWEDPKETLRVHREILNRYGEKEVLKLYEKSVREVEAARKKRADAQPA